MLNQTSNLTRRNESLFLTGKALLKGIGQIMLQNNFWTGLFFLAGICLDSLWAGCGAIVAVIIGTLTAKVLKYDNEEINSGLYGFSPALVGVALTCLFQPTTVMWVAMVVGSVLATLIQHLFIKKNIPAFTFPFILVTWFLLIVAHYYPTLIQSQPGATNTGANDYLALFAHGFGQVIFMSNIWSGVLFIIGILINRPVAVLFAFVGIALSSLIANQLREPINDIYLGLFSYNAVLCAITFAGKKAGDLLMAFLAIVFSVLIMIFMRRLDIPALTFPFVLATWLTLVIRIVKERLL
jgi:urea transporter